MDNRNYVPPACALLIACLVSCAQSSADDTVSFGPRTEDRFPPLVIPDGFRATLFACDPLVEYPSVIALGPRPGTLYVAYDYMTGLGVEIIRRDEVRLVADTDDDGYADTSTLFADGFNSIQGLAFDGEAVYVMHAPFLTRVRDSDGDGVADDRRDLLSGLGLPPEENSNRLHCANGVVVGHDGWLYLALGDRGCDTERPEGDRLLFQEGGILRCRTDGTDLHVFSRGLRNIYDVALDEDLNVFVRDNENDGGIYMIRVCHCFFGSDHGYPYHYYERPDEAMTPLADLGRGSSAGGTTYLENAFPDEFRQSLYFCEWGRAVVRYPFAQSGSGFAPVQEADFAAGASDDPYGFKPTDLVVDYEGSILISDWCDGQRPKRGRGRIYRIEVDAPTNSAVPIAQIDQLSIEELISQLDSQSYHQRVAVQGAIQNRGEEAVDVLRGAVRNGRMGVRAQLHTVWILAQAEGNAGVEEVLELAESNPDPRVVVQAIRAVGDLTDPILVEDRLNAGRGDRQVVARLAALAASHSDLRVIRETVIALGRLQYAEAASWVRDIVTPDAIDSALGHAVVQLLRRSANWPLVLELLDEEEQFLGELTLVALAEQADAEIADGLIDRLDSEPSPERRIEYADVLSRICRLPGPWTYWGFRPGPRPANTETWERTAAIQAALDRRLTDPDHDVRSFVLQRIVREELSLSAGSLSAWLREETDPEHVASILAALSTLPFDETRPLLEGSLRNQGHSTENRLDALSQLSDGLESESEHRLLPIAKDLEDGPVLAALLADFGTRTDLEGDSLLIEKLKSQESSVRAAAIRALAARRTDDVREELGRLLNDPSIDVLREAVAAAGVFQLRSHSDRILDLADHEDDELKRNCLLALRGLNDSRAVSIAIDGLDGELTQLASLAYLEHFGGPEQLDVVAEVAEFSLDVELQLAVVRALSTWSDRASSDAHGNLQQAIAHIQGRSGTAMRWFIAGPTSSAAAEAALSSALSESLDRPAVEAFDASAAQIAGGADARIALDLPANDDRIVWLAASDVFVDEAVDVEFLASSQGTLTVWLNGEMLLERNSATAYRPDSDRFAAQLNAGRNRILVRIQHPGSASRFHVRFRRRSSKAEHEQLMQYVLSNRGNVGRGQEVYENAEKSLCLKCHRMDPDGARIGPDMSGIGSRYSRVHILESILEPSRTIAPSYATISVLLTDGRVVTGINVDEDESTLTIGDNQGKLYEIPADEIDARNDHELSTMPIGLEQRMSQREILDLIEFLSQQTN